MTTLQQPLIGAATTRPDFQRYSKLYYNALRNPQRFENAKNHYASELSTLPTLDAVADQVGLFLLLIPSLIVDLGRWVAYKTHLDNGQITNPWFGREIESLSPIVPREIAQPPVTDNAQAWNNFIATELEAFFGVVDRITATSSFHKPTTDLEKEYSLALFSAAQKIVAISAQESVQSIIEKLNQISEKCHSARFKDKRFKARAETLLSEVIRNGHVEKGIVYPGLVFELNRLGFGAICENKVLEDARAVLTNNLDEAARNANTSLGQLRGHGLKVANLTELSKESVQHEVQQAGRTVAKQQALAGMPGKTVDERYQQSMAVWGVTNPQPLSPIHLAKWAAERELAHAQRNVDVNLGQIAALQTQSTQANAAATAEKQLLASRLAGIESEITQAEQALTAARGQQGRNETQMATLKAQIETLRAQHASALEERNEKEKALHALQSTEKGAAFEAFAKKDTRAGNPVVELNGRFTTEQLDQTAVDRRTDRATAKKERAELQSQIDEILARHERVRRGFAEIRSRLETEQTNQLAPLLETEATVAERIAKLAEDIRAQEARIVKLKQNQAQLKTDITQQGNAHAKFVEAKANEIAQLEQQKMQLQAELTRLQEQKSQLEKGDAASVATQINSFVPDVLKTT